jgi:hypothetical protein
MPRWKRPAHDQVRELASSDSVPARDGPIGEPASMTPHLRDTPAATARVAPAYDTTLAAASLDITSQSRSIPGNASKTAIGRVVATVLHALGGGPAITPKADTFVPRYEAHVDGGALRRYALLRLRPHGAAPVRAFPSSIL